MDALRRETISENCGWRHVPGEGGGAGDGACAGLAGGVDGRRIKAFIMDACSRILSVNKCLGELWLVVNLVSLSFVRFGLAPGPFVEA